MMLSSSSPLACFQDLRASVARSCPVTNVGSSNWSESTRQAAYLVKASVPNFHYYLCNNQVGPKLLEDVIDIIRCVDTQVLQNCDAMGSRKSPFDIVRETPFCQHSVESQDANAQQPISDRLAI